MLDIIKIIVELVNKFINPTELSKMKKGKQLRELGAELFLLYTSINEILIAGEYIITGLQNYLKHVDAWKEAGHVSYGMSETWLVKQEVEHQALNIIRLRRNLVRFSQQLQIINAEAYSKLYVLTSGKLNALSTLISVMGDNDVPLSVDSELESQLQSLTNTQQPFSGKDYEELNDKMRHMLYRVKKEAISFTNTPGWNVDTYKLIEYYIDSGRPQKQLSEIRAALQQLYVTLKENFTIQDILLEVGDKRVANNR